jgi:hypothetical protein
MEIIIKKTFWVFVVVLLFPMSTLFAQQAEWEGKKDFDYEIRKMSNAIKDIKKSNKELKTFFIKQNNKIYTLEKLLENKEEVIKQNIETLKEDNNRRILGISRMITIRSFVWIFLGMGTLLLGVIAYLILRKKLLLNKRTFEEQISKTREVLESESIKLDSRLMEILEAQLQISKTQIQGPQKENEIDHSLPLRVGEEIHRMRKRIEAMPTDVKGIGALKNSLTRLEEEFNENGYTILDLLNKPWNDGLTVSARFVPDENLKPGEHVIKKIIKPQINFKGVLIKAAEIEVNTGG